MSTKLSTATDRTDLEPITPKEAARLWRESKMDELADATLELQGFHIDQFVEWLDSEGLEDVRDITARTVHRFRLDIKSEIAQSTLSQRVSTIRRFLTFAASIEAVDPAIPERIEVPNRNTEARDENLEPDQADACLSYIRKYHYASREHALLALCWHTALRTGTLRALDVADVEESKNRLRIRHRPESDTPLKNANSAERYVVVSEEITEVLRDYIQQNRPSVTDEYERKPLFATGNGRAPVKTLRRWFQRVTMPCNWGGCPHGRDPAVCDAAKKQKTARDCPSSVSGHPIRRGAITRHLREDVPEKVVSDRCNVSSDVLDEHYDRRTDDEKAEQRRQFVDGL